MENVQINLLEQMAKKDIRQITKMSKAAGVSELTVHNILHNKTKSIRLDTIVKLCKALDCEIGDLIVMKKEAE